MKNKSIHFSPNVQMFYKTLDFCKQNLIVVLLVFCRMPLQTAPAVAVNLYFFTEAKSPASPKPGIMYDWSFNSGSMATVQTNGFCAFEIVVYVVDSSLACNNGSDVNAFGFTFTFQGFVGQFHRTSCGKHWVAKYQRFSFQVRRSNIFYMNVEVCVAFVGVMAKSRPKGYGIVEIVQ